MVQLLWKCLELLWQFLKKLNIIVICPRNSAPRHISKRLKTYVHTDMYTQIVALFKITKKWKQPKCPLTEK